MTVPQHRDARRAVAGATCGTEDEVDAPADTDDCRTCRCQLLGIVMPDAHSLRGPPVARLEV